MNWKFLLLTACIFATFSACQTPAELTVSPKDKNPSVSLSLLKEQGSVILRREGRDDIMVAQDEEGNWRAVVMRCPFDGQALEQKRNRLRCPKGEAVFHLHGKVQKAPRQEQPVQHDVEVKEGQVVILVREIT